MTREEKQLLLKDLCGRLPYELKGLQRGKVQRLLIMDSFGSYQVNGYNAWFSLNSVEFKPYLRPMSSMTEEELNECVYQSGIKDIECPNWQDVPKEKQFEARLNHSIAVFLTDSNNVDWLNAHHFDYRGLIEKGLALEAPENMYK